MTQAADDELKTAAAVLLGLDIPAPCLPGIRANFDLLRHHLKVLEAYEDGLPKDDRA